MNENIDLTKILKDCPKGTKFYSSLFGEVEFHSISYGRIVVERIDCLDILVSFNKFGKYIIEKFLDTIYFSSECILFPSKDQRDWSKFTAPWYKKDKFDPKTLKPFDKVLGKDFDGVSYWTCNLFSHYNKIKNLCYCVGDTFSVCIPYNDDTKRLVGTTDEAQEYYRYWED